MASVTERCPARVELSDIQVSWLDSRPHGTTVAEQHFDCDLENGHQGPHASLGQQGNDTEWWIYWTLSASELRQVDACPAIWPERDQNGEEVLCLLFQGHPGRHSFELARR